MLVKTTKCFATFVFYVLRFTVFLIGCRWPSQQKPWWNNYRCRSSSDQ